MGDINAVLRLIDEANSADPNTELADGTNQPKELVYGQRMSSALEKLNPDAPDVVKIAARAQHIERWTIPRADYPQGKKGYYQWRTTLGRYHGERAAEIMLASGYTEEEAARAQQILQKKNLKSDPEVQLLEDTICLVFLEYYLDEFATKHPEEKIIDILQKTWGKMSERGQQAALELDLTDPMRGLVNRALAA